jgi:sec-independent protein translocase protein TatA
MFAGIIGGWEVVSILALVLILFGGRKIPEIMQGLTEARRHVWKSLRELFDDDTFQAGRSLGGIYGKRAAQALTPDNQTAELYDPAVFRDREKNRQRPNWFSFWRQLWRTTRRWFSRFNKTQEVATSGRSGGVKE